MATVRPFRALRPRPADAVLVAAVPYDVVTTEEARAQADGNPLSFLRVSRPELELPPGTDPHSDAVYQRAVLNFERLEHTALVVDERPSLYVYRLTSGSHRQTGVAACFSLDEYDRNLIKKHEHTRRDKEDDRTRHMLALGAQTGPVFLVHRVVADIDALVARVVLEAPLFDFEASDGVQHTVWDAAADVSAELVAAFARVPALYIADGHHRAASAARARTAIADGAVTRPAREDDADYTWFLGVAFPENQVRILPYNRAIKTLGSLSPADFIAAVGERFELRPGPAAPADRGVIAMYCEGTWRTPHPRAQPDRADLIRALDVNVLQDQLLEPILAIGDVRTDPRIDFIGGARGTAELERLVDSGAAAVAFSLYPVAIADLISVSDAGGIMPPKSTWFEPKLRDGLLSHLI